MSTVSLPRSLVLKLLHLAQQGPGSGLITRQPDGSFKISSLTEGRQSKDDGTAFAYYRTALRGVPEADDIERCRGLTSLLLSVAVGTKGVLELGAWRIGDLGTDPVDLVLAEDDTVPA